MYKSRRSLVIDYNILSLVALLPIAMQFACSHSHKHYFGEDTTLLVSHTNAPDKGCPDGDASMLIVQSMACYIMNHVNKHVQFSACFCKPAPNLSDISNRFNDAQTFYFYDLHPTGSSVTQPKNIPKLHIYDHHPSAIQLGLEQVPFAGLSKAEIKEILPKISGAHLAACHFVHLMCTYYTTTDPDYAILKEAFYKEKKADQAIKAFSYMRAFAPIIQRDQTLSAHEPIKQLLNVPILNILENIGFLDLYSLGSGKFLAPLNKIGGISSTLENLAKDVLDHLPMSESFTQEGIIMNIYEQLFREQIQFTRDGSDAMLQAADLSGMLQRLSHIELTTEKQEQLRNYLLSKYAIFKLMQGVGTPSKPPIRFLHRSKSLKLDSQTVRVAYLPFSPSSGCAEDDILDYLGFTATEKQELKEATAGGTVRDLEPYTQHLMHQNSEPGAKLILLMEGTNSVSLRANFDMIDYDPVHDALVNNLTKLGITGGGHPRAAGCSKTDPKFLELKAAILSCLYCQIIILAAGNGRRMESELPKVMHEVGGLPMIERVMLHARQITDEVFLVYSSQLENYIAPYKELSQCILQPVPLGTADAVRVTLDEIDDNKTIIVLYGDNPLITPQIINEMLEYLMNTNSSITTLCFKRDNPGEYGRIVTNESGEFLNIVEFKDATKEERAIKICNSGIMAFKAGILKKYLPLVCEEHTDKSKELYLTSIIKTAKDKGEKVSYLLSSNENLVLGINNKQELKYANDTINSLELQL